MDCTFLTELGKFNFRVGAIITNGRKILMARNPNERRRFYYSVGGRVKFGETVEEAILREVKEETGIDCEIDRMAALHENFFTDDDGTPFHEVSLFFVIKQNEKLVDIGSGTPTEGGAHNEYLEWIDLDNSQDITIYPDFYRTVDFDSDREFKHFISKE